MNLLIRLCGVVVVSVVLGAAAFGLIARIIAMLVADPSLSLTLVSPVLAGVVAGVVATALLASKGK